MNENPYQEWIKACKGGERCLADFEYSVPLTEMVLLGNVAMRTGKAVEWDAENLKAKGNPDADQFIKGEVRKGWEV